MFQVAGDVRWKVAKTAFIAEGRCCSFAMKPNELTENWGPSLDVSDLYTFDEELVKLSSLLGGDGGFLSVKCIR